jgi:hypothetical protein
VPQVSCTNQGVSNLIRSCCCRTYQEALLSRRRLVFTDTQVYFQCRSTQFLETLEEEHTIVGCETTKHLRALSELAIDSEAVEIYDRLEDYYLRGLSYDSDILNAFSGIFQAFQKIPAYSGRPSSTNFYGIPIIIMSKVLEQNVQLDEDVLGGLNSSLASGLAWRVYGGYSSDYHAYRLDVDISDFPSWTWASLKARRVRTNPGRLAFQFRRYAGLSPLDRAIRIKLYHRDGTEMDLLEYARHEDDHTSFLPQIDITSMVISGSLSHEGSGPVTFSACAKVPLHLHQDPKTVGAKVLAVYVGFDRTQDRIDMAFILVEPVGDEQYRHIGVLSHRVTSARFDGRFCKSIKCDEGLLREICDGKEWHLQTLQLI